MKGRIERKKKWKKEKEEVKVRGGRRRSERKRM